jgi:hypothetical protein
VAARSFPLPSTFDNAFRELAGNLTGPIGAAVEHNDDLVGKVQTGGGRLVASRRLNDDKAEAELAGRSRR